MEWSGIVSVEVIRILRWGGTDYRGVRVDYDEVSGVEWKTLVIGVKGVE